METNGPIDRAEASAALAAVRDSRSRAAWSGYPSWYWLATGALMGALLYTIDQPGDWVLLIAAALGASLVLVTYLASRVRGVCEGWTRDASIRGDALVLGVPTAVVMVVNAILSKVVTWSSIPAAVLVFALYAGVGLVLSARAGRR